MTFQLPFSAGRAPLPWLLLLLVLLAGCGGTPKSTVRYHCPMHPTYVSDRPGDCPICGMKIVPIEEEPGADTPAATDAGAGEPGPGNAGPADHAVVHVDPAAAARAGVRTETAVTGRLARTVRTVGLVAADESRVRRAEARTGGWVRFLHVGATGRFVNAGEPLLVLESPELIGAQEEFAAARNSLRQLSDATPEAVRRNVEAMADAGRRKLDLLGFPKAMMDDLERTGRVQERVPVLAPGSGFVTVKDVYEGQRVEPGMLLFTITDLSRLWVEARVFEAELPYLSVGRDAQVTLPFDPGYVAHARVSEILPTLDADTRSLTLRLALDNAGTTLKPGMYADVTFDIESGEGVLVPDSAILDSGLRQIVFVKRPDDHYEPRTVLVGLRSDGRALLHTGVAAGEEVVSAAAFLVDSESRLRAAIGRAVTGGAAPAGEAVPAADPHAGHGGPR